MLPSSGRIKYNPGALNLSQILCTKSTVGIETGFQHSFFLIILDVEIIAGSRLNLVLKVLAGSIPTADYRPLRIGGDPATHTTLEPP
jgi:hypothetical protein